MNTCDRCDNTMCEDIIAGKDGTCCNCVGLRINNCKACRIAVLKVPVEIQVK